MQCGIATYSRGFIVHAPSIYRSYSSTLVDRHVVRGRGSCGSPDKHAQAESSWVLWVHSPKPRMDKGRTLDKARQEGTPQICSLCPHLYCTICPSLSSFASTRSAMWSDQTLSSYVYLCHSTSLVNSNEVFPERSEFCAHLQWPQVRILRSVKCSRRCAGHCDCVHTYSTAAVSVLVLERLYISTFKRSRHS